jgi:DNA repair exonuclease SbcCD ATPase subunit/DNA repair exonuclease SbcCD nuclease subunit
MRIIHTADWHLHPRNHVNTVPAAYAFQAKVLEIRPDIVLHGGDVFDTRGRIDSRSLYVAQDVFVPILEAGISVAIVPGNHDAANAWGEPSTATAALERLGAARMGLGSMTIFNGPGVAVLGSKEGRQLVLAGLPCPSKYHLAAGPETVKPDLLGMVLDVIKGLEATAVRFKGVGPMVLVIHATVGGAKYDNEREAARGQQLNIPLGALEAGPWDVIPAGDLHTPQEIGRVLYPGSLSPLTFAQTGHRPSFLLITLRDRGPDMSAQGNGGNQPFEFERVPLPVAQELIEVLVTPETDLLDADHMALPAVQGKLEALEAPVLQGAKVRVRVQAPAEAMADWSEAPIRDRFDQVAGWQFEVERLPAVRIRTTLSAWDNIGSLLADWVDLNPSVRPIQFELEEYATKLEAKLGTDLKPAASTSYVPIETTLKDFRQLGGVSIRWGALKPLVCIKGVNYAGKSNLALAEGFALYGLKAFPGEVLRKMVRDGQRQTSVVHTFDADGETWKIERTVKLSSTRKPTGDLSLARLASDIEVENDGLEVLERSESRAASWVSANKDKRGGTQAEIERLAGPEDVFFSTRFARQNETARLLTMGGTDRLRLLQREVQAHRFQPLHKHATAELRTLQAEFHGLTVNRDALADHAAELEGLQKWHRTDKKAAEAVAETIKNIEGGQEDLGVKIQAKAAELEALNVEVETLLDLETDKAKATDAVKDLIESSVSLKALLGRADEVAELLETRIELRLERDVLLQKHQDVLALEAERDKLIERRDGEVRAYNRTVEVSGRDIEHKHRQTALLESVPCQGGTFYKVAGTYEESIENDAPINMAACQFLLDAVKAATELPDMREGLAALKKGVPAADAIAGIKRLEDEALAVGFDPEKQEAVALRLVDLDIANPEAEALEIANAKGRLEELEVQLKDAEHKRDRLEAELDGKDKRTEELPEERGAIRTALATLEAELKNRKIEIAEAQADREKRLQELGRIEAKLEAAEGAADKLENVAGELEAVRLKVQVRQAYAAATGAAGIPFLLVERALPQLQSLANGFLSGTGLSLVIDPVRDLEGGKPVEEVAIRFLDRNGEHTLSSASGFQGNILGLALRAALAMIAAERAGRSVPLFVVDEGFGAYSAENLEHARVILRRLADTFGRVVYITHVPEVQEEADQEILVENGPNGSIVTVN